MWKVDVFKETSWLTLWRMIRIEFWKKGSDTDWRELHQRVNQNIGEIANCIKV